MAFTANSGSALTERFFENVLKRLLSFGCELTEDDAYSVSFCSLKIENHIKNSCNVTSLPDGLLNVAVDMVCGEFLFAKKQTGKLTLDDLDLDGAISSIHEGDTTVQFTAGQSDEEKFNTMVNYLLHGGEGELVCYRRIKW